MENTKNPNCANATEKDTILCDIETIITAEIVVMDRNVALMRDFQYDKYKEILQRKIADAILGNRLKDDSIKVQVFLHEKSEKTSKTE